MATTGKLKVTMRPWGGGRRLFRVHPERFRAAEFNPTAIGNARFSPLVGTTGEVVPTLYAGSTLDCALMETVFHDVPFVSGPKLHSKANHVTGKVISMLHLSRDLQMIDLTSIALRKLGILPEDLTRTDAAHYPETRAQANRIHQEQPEAQGLLWTSRQDDTGLAIVLFGDRMPSKALDVTGESVPLTMPDGSPIREVQALAARLDVLLI